MRENRKSILLAVISGIVACIVCVGVVFTFPTNKSNLKGNESTLPNNLEDHEEIKLGDTCGSWNYTSWTLDTSGYGAWTCGTPSGGTGSPPSSATGTVWHGVETGDHDNCTSPCNAPCYRTTTYKRTQTTCASYSACDEGKYLDTNNTCQTCPRGSMCTNSTRTGCSGTNQYQDEEGQTSCKTCISHGVATDHAAACTSCEQGYTYDANSNQCMPNSGCSDGQWRGQYGCEACPKGFKCSGNGSKVACDGANEYQDETGQTACKTCIAHGVKNNGNTAACTACANGYIYNASSNQCMPNSGCSDGQWRGQYGCEACPKGFKCPGGNGSKIACSGANEYQDEEGQSTCKTCPSHSVKNNGDTAACTACEASFVYNSYTNECIPISGCSDGYWRGQNGCEACTAGYYCPDGIHKNACPTGYTSEAKAKSESDCYKKTSAMTCSISVTKVSENVSIDDIDPTKNSFYTVKVSVNGQGCSGQSLTYTAENGRLSKGGETNITSGFNYTFAVYPQTPCAASSATATLTDGKSGTVSFERLAVKVDWKSQDGCWPASEVEGKYPVGSQAADKQGKDIYYSDYAQCGNDWGYTKVWTRSICGKSTPRTQTYSFCCVKNDGSSQSWLTGQTSKTCPEGYTLDETKNSNTCLKTFACYKDSDNNTYWTSDPQPSWVVVPKSEQECKDQEACFEDATGQRFWGKHYDQIANGYILITSIKDEDTCVNPSDDDACYINDEDLTDYRWSKTPLTGYTKADSIKNAKECQPDACYIEKEKNEFAFGKYKDNENYIPVYKTIEVDGEYKDVLITDKKECTNEVPVEPTDFDVAKLVYVFMAILMACGIAFIYYSSVAKKQNQ